MVTFAGGSPEVPIKLKIIVSYFKGFKKRNNKKNGSFLFGISFFPFLSF